MNTGKLFTHRILHFLFLIVAAQVVCLSSYVSAKDTAKSNEQLNNKTEVAENFKSRSIKLAKQKNKAVVWTGEWSRSERFSPAGLEIKSISKNKISFEISATSGANTGGIGGTAKVSKNKAFFDDKIDVDKTKFAGSYGCQITFINQGNSIKVETSDKCENYGGVGVDLGGIYKKGKIKITSESLADLEILPDKKTNEQFKKLVGRDYQKFVGSFQLNNEESGRG